MSTPTEAEAEADARSEAASEQELPAPRSRRSRSRAPAASAGPAQVGAANGDPHASLRGRPTACRSPPSIRCPRPPTSSTTCTPSASTGCTCRRCCSRTIGFRARLRRHRPRRHGSGRAAGWPGWPTLAETAHGLGLGVLVDVVPNHVGIAVPEESVWWWDVLRHGRESVHAEAFDIDWAAGDGRILLPVLGDGPDELGGARPWSTASCATTTTDSRSRPGPTGGTGAGGARPAALPVDLLASGRCRAELPAVLHRHHAGRRSGWNCRTVFADSHVEIRRWIESGMVDGLRIDHPDGLADPGGYLDDLAGLTGGRYTAGGEDPRARRGAARGTGAAPAPPGTTRSPCWTGCSSTRPARPRLDALDAELRGGPADWPR